jgi:WD40 repeat protein
LLATGGKGKELNLFSTDKLKLKQSAKLEGRIWDIGFLKHDSGNGQDDVNEVCAMAVASGDYKTIFFETDSLEPTLEVIRSRTVRCLDYHPSLPLLAVGDGASMVAIVDYREEETITEFETGGRVNVLKFSPAGDYLLVGTDDCMFSLHETVVSLKLPCTVFEMQRTQRRCVQKFSIVQEFERSSFALAASFSPTGKYLALGSSNEDYSVLRLGALLGIDFVPLDTAATRFPGWALDETLFRSGFGPSLVQRHMISGSQESLQWVASALKEHPDSIYTCNRSSKEGCFDTALRLRKIKLLQVAVTTLVDGSLEARNEGRRSILTTDIPEIGRKTLEAMLAKHPPEVIVEILKQMTFVKVPFTSPHVVSREKKLVSALLLLS